MPNVQQIYVKGKGMFVDEGEGEEEKTSTLLQNVRPESRLKIKNYLMKRNEHALRAYARFPNEADFEVILSKTAAAAAGRSAKHTAEKPEEASFSILQESTLMQDGGVFGDQNSNFSDYLAGKIPVLTPPVGGPG